MALPDALDIAAPDPATERRVWAELCRRYPWAALPTKDGLPIVPDHRRAEVLAMFADPEMRDVIKALMGGEVDEIADGERGGS